jgi:hypothetical protein
MKFVIICSLILFSLALTLDLPCPFGELSFAQSLTSPTIHSIQPYKHTALGLRTKNNAPKHITGNGTSIDPYVLYDAQDVDSIRYLGLNNKYYELANNIDLSSISEFVPIPYDANSGTFSLDGKNHILSGMKQTLSVYSSSSSATSLGMFMGRGSNGIVIIKDLIIDGFKIHLSSSVNQSGTYTCGSILIAHISYNSSTRLTNITIRNSTLNFSGNPSSYPSQSYYGFLVGRFETGSPNNSSLIKNCLVENDSLIFASGITPNSGHAIGGIVGYLGGSYAYQFEYNISRNNYFYSRVGYTIRTNVGGGLIGIISSPASTFRYNYSHSNKADFGNGGSPNNFPWGWGGIFGYTSVNNIHTFQENYAANNECLGANQSGGFYSEDNSTTTAQAIDSTLNFCDITNFAEPNTVYGSVRYSASQYPAPRTSAQLKVINTFIGWDFTNTWAIDSTKNSGYPYLLSNN